MEATEKKEEVFDCNPFNIIQQHQFSVIKSTSFHPTTSTHLFPCWTSHERERRSLIIPNRSLLVISHFHSSNYTKRISTIIS